MSDSIYDKIQKPVTRQQVKTISSKVRSYSTSPLANSIFSSLKEKQQYTTNNSMTETLKVLDGMMKQSNLYTQQEETARPVPSSPMSTYVMQGGQMMPNPMINSGFTGMSATPAQPWSASQAWGKTAMTVTPVGGSGSGVNMSLEQVSSLLGVRTAKNPFYTGGAGNLSATERTEMASYLQRYILEGYARGVDIPAMIKKLPGGQLKVGIAQWSGNGIGVGGKGVGSLFRKDWWYGTSVGKRMGLFFQEISHGLGLMMDSQNPDFGFERGWMHGAVDASNQTVYNKNFDMLFQDFKKYVPNTISTTPTGNGAGGMPFPDPAMDPNAAGTGAPAPMALPTITPPAMMDPLQPGNIGGNMSNVVPDSSPQTTIGLDETSDYSRASGDGGTDGGLDENISQSTEEFANVLQNIPQSSGPMLQGLAGALL